MVPLRLCLALDEHACPLRYWMTTVFPFLQPLSVSHKLSLTCQCLQPLRDKNTKKLLPASPPPGSSQCKGYLSLGCLHLREAQRGDGNAQPKRMLYWW